MEHVVGLGRYQIVNRLVVDNVIPTPLPARAIELTSYVPGNPAESDFCVWFRSGGIRPKP